MKDNEASAAPETPCPICRHVLASAQQYWPIHDDVAKWLDAFESRRVDNRNPATLAIEASELLAHIVRSYAKLPRSKAAESPF
ncbi:hypothetical protein Q5H92_26410 [Hymenobacter sp. M29]|uniref:Uncharacterized protein n=1 Tax=Hymenobacter mellowenesis TaxID=3063995 RepID=A0ABT9AKS5_9BACT|nr:hypothetical protein [Hymenobacter sp. M29]MDO7849920.1 hypothetical protein [Hymenobacter sp. M29]